MCLYRTKPFNSREAKDNIRCYKILFKLDDSTYITPFTRQVVTFNEEYHNPYNVFIECHNPISKGVFHTFIRKEDAQWTIDAFRIHCRPEDIEFWKRAIIVQATIPKGTKFYRGVDSNYKDSYGSYSVIYLKECN